MATPAPISDFVGSNVGDSTTATEFEMNLNPMLVTRMQTRRQPSHIESNQFP